MLDLADLPGDFTDNPFEYYDLLLRDAPVCPQRDGSFILSRHADLTRVYKDTCRFISDKRQAFGPKFGRGTPLYEHHTTSLVFNDPPLHSRVRRIMTAALTPKAMARLEPGLVVMVGRLLDEMHGEADLVEDFAAQIPIQVIGNLLDIPMADRGPLRDWSLNILGALEPVLTNEQLTKGHLAVTEFSSYLRDLAAHRRRHPGDPETDVLTRLIQGDGDCQLSEVELIQNCIFILNAGHETTTNLIANSLALLNDHPEDKLQLLKRPESVNGVVEEVLRLRSPNQFGNRQTSQEVEIRGQKIPAGTNLHLCIGAANRDPEVFENPADFDPQRSPNRHLAFAGGPHICVGLTLARMEGRIALQKFIERFPGYRVTQKTTTGRVRFRGFAKLRATLE